MRLSSQSVATQPLGLIFDCQILPLLLLLLSLSLAFLIVIVVVRYVYNFSCRFCLTFTMCGILHVTNIDSALTLDIRSYELLILLLLLLLLLRYFYNVPGSFVVSLWSRCHG
mmetsp:Transcript_4896/g.13896  ORF Transcript_4896/g.13896 Transcript_4896/m.13896 type:complete len:112 (-) Transcript_4896:136-471(-)